MKCTNLIMGMPVTVDVIGGNKEVLDIIFGWFKRVDERYSTYKPASEISRINDGLPYAQWSSEMKRIIRWCEETKHATRGYFDIRRNGKLDPSGLVKGWAIYRASRQLKHMGYYNFRVEAGGDMQVGGHNAKGEPWQIGVRNPFNHQEIIKVVALEHEGIATSGTDVRGQHIYNPHNLNENITDVTSLTVIGPNVYEADRFATAAFAMGKKRGLAFLGTLPGFAAYLIDSSGTATYTANFARYVA